MQNPFLIRIFLLYNYECKMKKVCGEDYGIKYIFKWS